MFGFKHTMDGLDHNDHKVHRSRLYGRLLEINGPKQIAVLYPYIQSTMEKHLQTEVQKGILSKGRCLTINRRNVLIYNVGWTSVRLAPMIRHVLANMMSLVFFGENICKYQVFVPTERRIAYNK